MQLLQPRSFFLAFSVSIGVVPISEAQTLDAPGGFMLGSSFNEVEEFATQQGWVLEDIDQMPDWWTVEGTNINLLFCDNLLATVEESFPGSFDTFVDKVWKLKLLHGEPELQITKFFHPGGGYFRQTSASFRVENSFGIGVNFYSLNGESRRFETYGKLYLCDPDDERQE